MKGDGFTRLGKHRQHVFLHPQALIDITGWKKGASGAATVAEIEISPQRQSFYKHRVIWEFGLPRAPGYVA